MTATEHPHPHAHHSWLYMIAGIVIVVLAFLMGVVLSRGSSAIACTRTINSGQGSCINGSWGPWVTVSQSTDPKTGQITAQQERTYTGMIESISGTLSYNT